MLIYEGNMFLTDKFFPRNKDNLYHSTDAANYFNAEELENPEAGRKNFNSRARNKMDNSLF